MPGPDEQLVRLSEAEAQRLTQFYTDAEREILDEINRALLKGNKTEYLKTMQTNVQAILKELREGSRTWCEQAIPQIYTNGAMHADRQLEQLGEKVQAGFGAIHQQAAQVLAEHAYNRFDDVALTIGRKVDDIYRTLALENIRGSVAGYKTWQQAAKSFREQLAAQGATGFKDVKDRLWNMKSYAEMVARTTTMEAHLQGTTNRLVENGHDLVKVSRHSRACPKCVLWEGKILSLTGKTEGYPTLQEAKDGGLFHPNCRHAFGLYLPELSEHEPEQANAKEMLPNYEKAVIPEEKLLKYALNKNHKGGGKDKAIAFDKALGYNRDNYQDLIDNINKNLSNSAAVYKGKGKYGERYEVSMDLTGPNGKTAKVLTGWLVENNGQTRLVSVYVDKGK